MKITLAKALNLKNRLAEKLNKVTQQIQQNNSIIKGKERQVDIATSILKRVELQAALIAVKTAIYKANQGIQETIYTNAERKVEIAFLNGINTQSGVTEKEIRWGQNEKMVEYDAVISYQKVQENVTRLEAEIDRAQDEIDAYNHATKIDVPEQFFELLK